LPFRKSFKKTESNTKRIYCLLPATEFISLNLDFPGTYGDDFLNDLKIMPKRFFFILLAYTFLQNVAGQMVISDSDIQKVTSNTIDVYYHALGDQSPLYNGSEYIEYASTLQEGHPFFESSFFAKGSIRFDGMEFQDVPMLYDIIKDQVIIQHFGKVYKINLPAEKIERFTLTGHNFIRIIQDSSHQLKTGFYDRLYNGKIMVLAKREKKIREERANFQISNVVDQKSYYYIKKDGIYYSLKNMRSLLGILKSKKKEIQQYFNKNKVKYKNNPEQAMSIAAEYYDRLTN